MRPEPDALFNDHHLAIYRFLLRMTRRRDDAEDLTQEVFLRVVRGIGSFEGRGLDRAWLFRIARNLLLDRQRRLHRSPDIAADVSPDELPGREASVPDGMALDRAIAGLPELDREALLLREVSGLTYGEIAAVASRSPLTTLFDPLTWALSGETVTDGRAGAALRLEAVTSVRGLVRPDGKIAVTVRYHWFVGADRWPRGPSVGVIAEGGGGRSGAATPDDGRKPRAVRAVTSGGMKMLQMEDGQTISLVVPLPNQDLSVDTPSVVGVPLAPGVSVSGPATTVDLEKFFAGTETSVILTVKRR